MEARVHYLEQQSEQLNQHVRLLKQLVTTEVAELRSVMEKQIAEVQQVVMHQDRLYQERIRRLELRVEQLSEFCLHMARSTGHAGMGSVHLPVEATAAQSSAGLLAQQTPRPTVAATSGGGASASGGGGEVDFDDDDDDDDPSKPKGAKRVLHRYQQKINGIYDFYTSSSIEVFHPSMTISQFARLVKDCRLVGLEQGTSHELLWMAVLRRLNTRQDRRRAQANRNITLGKYPKTKKDSFAFERLETIPKQLFGEALAVLAAERSTGGTFSDASVNGRSGMATDVLASMPEDVLTRFLLYQVFPYTDAAIEQLGASSISHGGTGDAAENGHHPGGTSTVALTIQEYKTDAVKLLVKGHMGKIKSSFQTAIRTAQDYHSTTMSLDGFVEVVRSHELLPLIGKPDVRQIFMVCSAMEQERRPGEKEGYLSLGSYIVALYHLADRIYGSALMAGKYSTAEARMRKLLTKMFLLNQA